MDSTVTGGMARRRLKLALARAALLALVLPCLPVSASDGDMQYSSPYLWVDPETGELKTINPGPRLKSHEPMPVQAELEPDPAAAEAAPQAAAGAGDDAGAGGQGGGLQVFPALAGLGILLAAGFVLLRRRKGEDSGAG